MSHHQATIDYYEVLQVHPSADPEVIAKAYRTLMVKHHPDHGGDVERARLLNEAYAVLQDPDRRRRYDASRASGKGTTALRQEAATGALVICIHCEAKNRIRHGSELASARCGRCREFLKPRGPLRTEPLRADPSRPDGYRAGTASGPSASGPSFAEPPRTDVVTELLCCSGLQPGTPASSEGGLRAGESTLIFGRLQPDRLRPSDVLTLHVYRDGRRVVVHEYGEIVGCASFAYGYEDLQMASYRVEVLLNGQPVRSLHFWVRGHKVEGLARWAERVWDARWHVGAGFACLASAATLYRPALLMVWIGMALTFAITWWAYGDYWKPSPEP